MRWLSLVDGSANAQSDHEQSLTSARVRAFRRVEWYILSWLALEAISTFWLCVSDWPSPYAKYVVPIVVLRIADIIQSSVNAAFFSALSTNGRQRVASNARSLTLAAVNYFELALCFGIIYAAGGAWLSNATSPLSAFYFSAITQLSIGYGDIAPRSWLRLAAVVQGFAGLFLIVLVFGRFVASMKPVRELIDPQSDESH